MARAVDDGGIELDVAEDVRLATETDAPVRRIRLGHSGAGLDGVEGASAAAENADPGGQPGRAVPAGDDRGGGTLRQGLTLAARR